MGTIVLIAHFLEYAQYLWMIMRMKIANNFQIAKVQPLGAA